MAAIQTRDQFLERIQSAPFFANVGNMASEDGVISISSLAPWGDEANASETDNRIANEMNWLPTVRDQDDPFYPNGIERAAGGEDKSKLVKSFRAEVYKAVLARLRNVEMTQLKAGMNSFEEAARGAAAYAIRNAAAEVVLGLYGKWLEVAEFYFQGRWPCGMTKKEKLVIL